MTQFRHAIGWLVRRPGFTLTALLILALGIGANTAMFTFVDAVLLRPLPVRDPERLVVIGSSDPRRPGVSFSMSYPAYRDLRDGSRALADVLARAGAQFSVATNGDAERIDGELVSGNYFSVLGVDAVIGRVFTPEDDRVGNAPVAVLDHGYWVRRFGGATTVIGRDILVNGQHVTIVGVTPRAFYGTDLGRRPAIRVPLAMTPLLNAERAGLLQTRSWRWLTLVARLAPGVSLEQARTGLALRYRQVLATEVAEHTSETPSTRERMMSERLDVQRGEQGFARLRQTSGRPLVLLMFVTLAVWLIACVNLANLLLAHGVSRQRELAIRLALGGTRGHLVRQLMSENLVLAIAGGTAGLLVAAWLTGLILGLLPMGDPLAASLGPDLRVLGVTFLLSMLTALTFGFVPALRATRGALLTGLKTHGDQRATAAGAVRAKSLLIVAQVALSVVLLAVAALFVRSLANIYRIDPGFTRDHVVVAEIRPSLNGYTKERSRQVLTELLAALDRSPEIAASALGSTSPMSGGWTQNHVSVDGYTPHEEEDMSPSYAVVTPGYFSTLGIRLIRGRLPDARDTAAAPPVAVINETMAGYFFRNDDPIGRVIRMEDRPIEIVGVVSDSKYVDPREERTRFVYLPLEQRWFDGLTLLVRTKNAPGPAITIVRQALQSIDAQVPLGKTTTLDAQFDDALALERVLAIFTSAFGALAMLLAAVGLYGVLAFSVASRAREFGVRLALGARPVDVGMLVARQTAFLVGCGVVIGACGAAWTSRLVGALLYEVRPTDPATIAGAALLVTCVAAMATALPAQRATRVDPAVTMRNE